jgi:hypothetical protein
MVGTNVHYALKAMSVPPYEILWTNIFAANSPPCVYYASGFPYGEINNNTADIGVIA